MAGHEERQRPYGSGIHVAGTKPLPLFVLQPAEEREVRPPESSKLRHQIPEGHIIVVRIRDIFVLLERGERSLLPPADAEGTIPENPLRIDKVTDELADGPFPFRVSKFLAI